MRKDQFVIGVDYGTDSVRSVIVDAGNGDELASSVFQYPRWQQGLFCNAGKNQFRQHPLDYVEGLEYTIKDCIEKAGGGTVSFAIKAISIDTTGSTPVAVNEMGVPLALIPGFESNPNAMFVLWKDHTAIDEAEAINQHATKFPINYLQYVGGIYSSEWFWAKLLHVLKVDEQVRKACYSWVEHCDWIPFLLSGAKHINDMRRGRCAAGHKALWAAEYGGLPPDHFFSSLHPFLKGYTSRLYTDTFTSDQSVGTLSKEWAIRLGLSTGVIIGAGAFDAHMGAVGGQIEPYHLSKVMGTSTCDMLVAPNADLTGKLIKGICGQVDGSVIPGMVGLEAGQSAFGDTYAWFKNLISWPMDDLLAQSSLIDAKTRAALISELSEKIIPGLSRQAALLPMDENAELSVDWLNGRRTPDANQLLKSAITGLNLGSNAPRMFRSLAEGTCFGAKSIVGRFNDQGVEIKGLIGIGGVAKKSPYIMQMMADVLQMPIRIHQFEHTCALGAAMFAATVAGIYPKVEDAMVAMGSGFDKTYDPDKQLSAFYDKRYGRYLELGRFIENQTE
jgi:L-ribulokinase